MRKSTSSQTEVADLLLTHAAEEEAEEHGSLDVARMPEQSSNLLIVKDRRRFLEHLPRLDLGSGVSSL